MYLLFAYITVVSAWVLAANLGYAHGLPLYVHDVFVGDKVVHFFVVGLFALAVANAIRSRGCRPLSSLLLGMAIALLTASLEEASNALTPHRTASWLDLLADTLGVGSMGALGWFADFRDLSGSKPLLNSVSGAPHTREGLVV